MNDATHLVDRLRDGLMEVEEQQAIARRLAAEPELRAAILDEWRLQRRLAGLFADDDAVALWQRIDDGLRAGSSVSGAQRTFAAVEHRIEARRHPRQRALRSVWWPMLAALAAAAVLVVVLLAGRDGVTTRAGAVPALRVAAIQGEVRVVRTEGLFAARAGMVLHAADRVETLAESTIVLEMGDGSRLDLAAAAILGWDGEARFRLDQGTVAVAARPRSAATPLAITTPQAVATVVGTRFQLSHRDQRTMLRVTEGTVRFDRRDAPSLLVHAGQEAMSPLTVAATSASAVSAPTGTANVRSAGPQVVAFRFVEAESGRVLPGWERITTDMTVDATNLPVHGWTVIALTEPERVPAVQFRVDGMATGAIQAMPPYALTQSRSADGTSRFLPWKPALGTHRLEAVLCRSRTDATPAGRPLAITLTLTSAGDKR